MKITFRLLAAAMGAMALPAQNPLALLGDPFSGTFQNDQLKIELALKGAEHSGTIQIGGQSLPVKAKAAAGKLAGTFESGGQTYTFQATRSGSQITLITDGVTHVLEQAGAAAPPVVGDWQSPTGAVRVNADGTAAINGRAHRWTIEGNVITFAGNGESIKVPYEMGGNTWTWKFPEGQLVLTRMSAGDNDIAGSWQGPSGSVQINLDGTATVGGVAYRYTQAGNQLTLGGPDGTFVAIVQRAGDTMTWLVNGKTLMFQRAAAMWAVGGGSGILPELVGKWCQSNGACFTLLADGSFQYAAPEVSDGGTWTATPDSITTTSKKTGTKNYRVEKRNHPKTGAPMLTLDGAEFTTAYEKGPWR